MADKSWSFIYGLGATKYYEAAQAGSLTGAGSFSIGAVLAIASQLPSDATVFGNAVYGTSGAGIHFNSNGFLETANGTILQPAGTVLADADNAYGLTPEGDLLNNYKGLLTDPVTPVGSTPIAWPSLRPYSIAHVHMSVDSAGNQNSYLNGRLVAQTAVGLATNANPFRIGVNASAAQPMGNGILLSACYYHSAFIAGVNVAALSAQIMANRDVAGPLVNALDYVWSVKQQNFDARSNWVSVGAAATPITMVLTGGGTITPLANTLSLYNMPAMWS